VYSLRCHADATRAVQVIEVAVNLHPADRFAYAMSLRLRPPAA